MSTTPNVQAQMWPLGSLLHVIRLSAHLLRQDHGNIFHVSIPRSFQFPPARTRAVLLSDRTFHRQRGRRVCANKRKPWGEDEDALSTSEVIEVGNRSLSSADRNQIADHPRFHQLRTAQRAVVNDVETKSIVESLNRKREDLAVQESEGKPIRPEDKRELITLEEKVKEHPKLQALTIIKLSLPSAFCWSRRRRCGAELWHRKEQHGVAVC